MSVLTDKTIARPMNILRKPRIVCPYYTVFKYICQEKNIQQISKGTDAHIKILITIISYTNTKIVTTNPDKTAQTKNPGFTKTASGVA